MGKVKNAFYWGNEIVKYMIIKAKTRFVYRYLLDSESKSIMKIREKNLFHHYNIEFFVNQLVMLNKKFMITELSEKYGYKIVLYQMDFEHLSFLRMNYTKVLLENSEWHGKYRILTIRDSHVLDENEFVIPIYSGKLNAADLEYKFGRQIYIPKYAEVLIGTMGNQYFDVFTAKNDEIVCDCGAYDGTTELQIQEWTKGTYSKIYAFEPNEINCDVCEEFYKKNNLENIELIRKGIWSENKTLYFSVEDKSTGGRLSEKEGVESVQVATIDSVVDPNERITYIKMDIEGAELEAIKGAKETIKRCAPKLAICIYHRQDDLWKIPRYILGLNKKYRFYIRHYSSYYYETVLYACIK